MSHYGFSIAHQCRSTDECLAVKFLEKMFFVVSNCAALPI